MTTDRSMNRTRGDRAHRHRDPGAEGNPVALPDTPRRMVLAGLLSAFTVSLIPWAVAQPVTDSDQGAFLALSAIIAGRQALDRAMARRLYRALTDDDPKFPADTRKLLALINERKIDPKLLQSVLDTEKSALAPLPRKLATAWFMGIVGSGDKARVLAFEDALNAVIVGDKLKPPTYCYGVYGSWANSPAGDARAARARPAPANSGDGHG